MKQLDNIIKEIPNYETDSISKTELIIQTENNHLIFIDGGSSEIVSSPHFEV